MEGDSEKYGPYLKGDKLFERGERGERGEFSNIYEFPFNSNYRTKEIKYSHVFGYFGSFETFQKNLENVVKVLRKYMAEFLPDFSVSYELPDETNQGKANIAMEWINKRPSFESEDLEIRVEAAKSLDNLIEAACKIFFDTYSEDKKKAILPDIDIEKENILYGATRRKPSPQFYLVDVYPLLDITADWCERKIRDLLYKARESRYDFPKARLIIEQLKTMQRKNY